METLEQTSLFGRNPGKLWSRTNEVNSEMYTLLRFIQPVTKVFCSGTFDYEPVTAGCKTQSKLFEFSGTDKKIKTAVADLNNL